MREPVSIARLHELLAVIDGRLIRRVKRGPQAAGMEAGAYNAIHGYRTIMVDGFRYYSHRVIYAMHHGHWPTHEVDHIDGDKRNNHPGNLRDVEKDTNQQNVKVPRRNNRTGWLGVQPLPDGRFRAAICVKGRKKHLGCFDDPETAHATYVQAKRTYHKGNTL